MASITTSLGIGSGIDIKGTVSQLTAAEGKPQLDAIAAKTSVSQAKLSGLGTLKGALSAFQSAVKGLESDSLNESKKVSSSDEKILKVSGSQEADASAHAVKIESLAKPQRSVSNAEFKKSDVVSEGSLVFNDKDGTPTFSVKITKGENDTLEGLRDAINKAENNKNVQASIVNVDAKSGSGTVAKLVLTAKNPGLENMFTVDASLGDMRFNLNEGLSAANFATVKASDAKIIIDSQEMPAQPQRSIATAEFGENDVVKAGLLTFKDKDGNETFSVNIEAGNNDKIFAAIDAINNAKGNDSVVASIANMESKTNPGTIISKIVFTAKKPGVENKFTIDASKGDTRLTLDQTPENAQQSTLNTEFGESDVIKAGKLTFKDSSGATFSVDIKNDTTIVTTNYGEVDEEGNPLVTVETSTGTFDEDGNPITTSVTKPGTALEEGAEIPVVVSREIIKGNNKLEDLRDAINFSPENKYVEAKIETITIDAIPESDETEAVPARTISKLVLTSLQSNGSFTIDASEGDERFSFNAENFSSTTTANNYDTTAAAEAGEGGQVITRSSNTITDAIPGVTLTLVTTGSADINAEVEKGSVTKPVGSFVDAFNKLNDTLKQLTTYVKPGDPGNGPLIGDSTVQSIASRLKQIINSKVTTGEITSLNQLGVGFDKKGVMTFDSQILDKAVESNFEAVKAFLNASDSVATRLNTTVSQYLDTKGSLSTQQDSLNKQLVQLATEKTAVEKRLESTQKSLQQQFIAMDTAVSKFKSTGDFLTQALAPKTNNN